MIVFNRYNYDGCFEATPGVRRAVTTAVTLLRNKGHQVVPFKPPNLAKVYQMFGLFKSADEGRSIKGMLSNSLVDRESLGIWWIINSFPFWLQRMLAPLIAIKSPIIANLMSSNGRAKKSWKLWELNKTRLELVEEILREWSQEQIDVVIAPAMGVPAQPSGTAPWIPNANSYTSVYNVLDFPAGSVPVFKILTLTIKKYASMTNITTEYFFPNR